MRSIATEVGAKSDIPSRVPGWVIDTHRPCPKCKYDVFGLAIGQPCPECGKPIFFGLQTRPDFLLSDEPYWYLRMTRLALWMLFIAPFGAGVVYAVQNFQDTIMPMALGAAASLWVGALALLAISRPPDRVDNVEPPQINPGLRMAAVGSQTLWLVAAFLMTFATTVAWAQTVAVFVALAAGVGVIFAMLFVAEVADYAGDADRGKKLTRMAIVFAVLVGLASAGLQLHVSLPLPILSAMRGGVAMMSYLLVLAGVVTLWNFFQLAIVGNWAVLVAKRHDQQVLNLRERSAQEYAAGNQYRDNEPFGGPVQKPIGSMMGIKPSK